MKTFITFIIAALLIPTFSGAEPTQITEKTSQERMYEAKMREFLSGGKLTNAKWYKLILQNKKNGKFSIDANDVIPLLKDIKGSNDFVYGIKTRCTAHLKAGGKTNTAEYFKSVKAASSQIESTLAQIKTFFDDPAAKCKNPAKGFDIYAVSIAGEKLIHVSLDEKMVLREVR